MVFLIFVQLLVVLMTRLMTHNRGNKAEFKQEMYALTFAMGLTA